MNMHSHHFDPTPYLPHGAREMPQPMRQAIYSIDKIMLHAPGVDVHLAALHGPGTPAERLEMLGVIDGMGNTSLAALREMLRQARGANINKRGGANILLRPDPEQPHPWLFMDDIPTPRALALCRAFSGIVVETSVGNAQVRLLADRPLSLAARGLAQKVLQTRLQSDPGSTSGEKWGRLPGFTSRKPGKTGQWTNLVADTTGIHPLISAARLLFLAPRGVCAPVVSSPSPACDQPQAGSLAGGQVALSLGHPRTKADFAREALSKPLPDAGEGAGGWHEEFARACQSLRAGLPHDEIVQAIATRALQRGKRRTQADAEKYARATVQKAMRAMGVAP